ncbi:SWIM-type domain-containing protein [Citrus sinensis]|uniref:SWIM-type domain-containing protein n=1 Tax=Citrus sinensis TaxID=2711 RepID=A0ACB8LXX4_CITSI|nr:SWIM-type domain-containing protein [Citrus sinensis]
MHSDKAWNTMKTKGMATHLYFFSWVEATHLYFFSWVDFHSHIIPTGFNLYELKRYSEKNSLRLSMSKTKFRPQPASEQSINGERTSLLYFDIEAVIDGEFFSVGLAIPEQYSLHKLWVDIRDACWGHPIRNANGIKVQVIFPWQTEQQAILTDKDLLEAFEQLRVKGYNWARFAVTPKKVLPDINRVESSVDKCTQQLNNDVESGNEELYNCYDASVDEFEDDYETNLHGSDLVSSNPDDYEEDYETDPPGNDLDDYESGDDSGGESDDDVVQEQTCIKYEKNAGGFQFNSVGDEILLKPGQLFVNVWEFRKVLKVFAIRNGFRLKRVDDNYEATSDWIAATYLHLFKANPEIKISVIAAALMQRYGIECNNQRLYMAKRKALELLGEDHKTSYSKLFRYMHALLNSNHGSTVSIERDWIGGAEFPKFKRFFFCIDSSRRGFFEGCRPFIGVDGCHLKGPYKGVLLTAVSIDANYGIYPLAMCVVDTENNESWLYFLEKLYDQVGCNGGEGLCFMSDRQKGILNALERVFPLSFKRSSSAADFHSHMEELKNITPDGYEWLMKIPIACWAKHLFSPHTKCSHVINNMTESFNNWINNYRSLPIVRMFEKIMRLIHKRHEAALGWNDELPPVVRRKIVEGRLAARSLSIIFGHNETFEVVEDATKIIIVDLPKKNCDCGEWGISGLPCKHAICCIDAKRYPVEDFIHPYLKKTTFIGTYKHQFTPVPDEKKWPLELHDNLQPPTAIRSAGRPQTKRKKEADESSTFKRSSSLRCSHCDQWGHTKRTCPRATHDNEKKRAKKRVKGKAPISKTNSQDLGNPSSQTQSSAHDNGHLTQE